MKEFFFLQIFCFNFITQYFICANLIQKLFDIQYNRSQRSLRMKNDHINLINLKIDFLNPNDFRFAIRWWFDHYGNGDALPIRYVCWAITWVCQRMLYHYMSLSYVCCTITWVCQRMLYHYMSHSYVCCTITEFVHDAIFHFSLHQTPFVLFCSNSSINNKKSKLW